MNITISKKTDVKRTARVMQMEGIFQMSPTTVSESAWQVDMPIEDWDWKIGLIVGPSGSGKSTVASHVFKDAYWADRQTWTSDTSIVDEFPKDASIKTITELLSSVGFSSPPAWLRSYQSLSTGEQFRVTVARALMEASTGNSDTICIDEFTSVIDRQVAQIGSASIAKAIRRGNTSRLVAISCHSDIIDWLQPDWLYEPATNTFSRRSVQRRPEVNLEIYRVDRSAWDIFSKHHYLDVSLSKSAKCFVACVDGKPAAFCGVMMFPHRIPSASTWRISRIVCLPDYQGIGIGMKMCEYIGSIFEASNHHLSIVTGHPSLIRAMGRSANWTMRSKPGLRSGGRLYNPMSATRMTAGFRYNGPPLEDDARAFGLIA